MTLKEKFENVEIMFESQIGHLKYDELYEASNQCEKIADDYAIEFANWFAVRYTEAFFYQENYTEDLLVEFKKEKGL